MNNTPRGKYFWITASAVLIVLLAIVSIPVRSFLSKRFISSGDSFLAQKKFVSAVVEYNKAKVLSTKSVPDQKIALAKSAETNILAIETSLRENNSQSDIDKIAEAKEMPADEVDAVKKAREMIEQGFYQQAIILLNTAIEMDRTYKDAWLYLGIAQTSGANDPEVSKEGRAVYEKAATEAFTKVLEIDPANEYAKKLLAE